MDPWTKIRLALLIYPTIVGIALRFFLRKTKAANYLSAALMLLAALLWFRALVLPVHGSEGPALFAILASVAAAASLLTGIVIRLVHRIKHSPK